MPRAGRVKVADLLTDDGLVRIGGWARDGLTNEQIAENIGIRRETLWKWSQAHDELAEELNRTREVVDRHVENALYKRAIGYEYTETKTVTDAEGGVTTTVTEKQMAPDVVAQIFWLKNRRPDKWRDRQEIGLDGTVGLVQIIDDIPKP